MTEDTKPQPTFESLSIHRDWSYDFGTKNFKGTLKMTLPAGEIAFTLTHEQCLLLFDAVGEAMHEQAKVNAKLLADTVGQAILDRERHIETKAISG